MHESCQVIFGVTLLGVVGLFWLGDPACAQIAAPTSGTLSATPNDTNKRHNGPTGKPCLSLSGSAKPQVVNKEIFDHWVSAANSCGQHIKVNVCYYKSQNCIMMDVPPYERKDVVLGVFPKLQDFRFEFKEQF
jgi:hypothetical protein